MDLAYSQGQVNGRFNPTGEGEHVPEAAKSPGVITWALAIIWIIATQLLSINGWWLVVGLLIITLGGALASNRRYVTKRMVSLVPTLFFVTLFTFYLQNGRGTPEDIAYNILGPSATAESVAQKIEELHLDEPLHTRYLMWLSDAVSGDLGESPFLSRPVSEGIANALPISFRLMIYAQLTALAIAIPAGVFAAYRAGTPGDRAVSTAALSFLSVPNFVLAVVFILTFALGGIRILGIRWGVDWFPATVSRSSYVTFGENPWKHFQQMLLPTLVLALGQSATYMRLLRSDMIATLQENFVTTAKAKGVPTWRILWGHALRPSSFTLLTVLGINTAALIGGTLIVETLFSLPGLGTYLATAIFQKDFLVVQGVVVVIAVGFVLINFFVDLLYAVLDPRIRHA